MHQLGFVLFTYTAAVLHVGLGSAAWAGFGGHPHVLMLVAITAVLYFDDWTALVWAAIAGLLSDCVSMGPLGIEMACFTAAGFVMHHHLRRHAQAGIVRVVLLSFLATLATLALSNTLRLVITGRSFDHARLVILVISTSLMTAAVVGGFRILQTLARRFFLPGHRTAGSY